MSFSTQVSQPYDIPGLDTVIRTYTINDLAARYV